MTDACAAARSRHARTTAPIRRSRAGPASRPPPWRRWSGRVDTGELRVAEPVRRRLAGQRVGQAGDPPLLPRARRWRRSRSGRTSTTTRSRSRPAGPSAACASSRRPRSRHGAFVSPGAVLMPCYVNIGAWVGPGTMVDTWATVGSCAQIGADVHLVRRRRHRRRARAAAGRARDHRGRRVHRLARDRRRGRARRRARRCSARTWCSRRRRRSSTSPAPSRSRSAAAVPPRSVVVPGTRTKSVPGRRLPACRAR